MSWLFGVAVEAIYVREPNMYYLAVTLKCGRLSYMCLNWLELKGWVSIFTSVLSQEPLDFVGRFSFFYAFRNIEWRSFSWSIHCVSGPARGCLFPDFLLCWRPIGGFGLTCIFWSGCYSLTHFPFPFFILYLLLSKILCKRAKRRSFAICNFVLKIKCKSYPNQSS